jgi:hypothetical protein
MALTLVALPAAAAVCAGACAKPERVQMGQVMRMGQFVLRADSVQTHSRDSRYRPLEVRVVFTLGGGNRFDRLGFAEAVTYKSRVYLNTSAGWRDRCAFGWIDEDLRTIHVSGYPPGGSSGFTLEIGNPYGEPRRFILDLGK